MRKILLSLGACILALGLSVGEAEAKRLGGGKSIGTQRESVSAAPKPAAPAQSAAQPASPAAAAAPAAQPKRSWLGPLAGLAAGIGLAALFSHFGLGEGLANILLIGLLVVAVIFVLRLIFRRSAPATASEPLHYAGIGGPHLAPLPESCPSATVANTTAPGLASAAPLSRNIPADFDVEGFLRVAKVNFIRLQAAHDAGNLADIRDFTTPEMFAEIKLDIDERQGRAQNTDVQALEAELLEVDSQGERHYASVRFRGMIREELDSTAQSFDEVWNLMKPADGSRGWTLAGIQQFH